MSFKLEPISHYANTQFLSTVFLDPLYKVAYLNPKKDLPLQGGNEKSVLVLVYANYPLPPQEEILLFKILGSIKLEIKDIYLLKIDPNFPFSLGRILKIIQPEKLLIFGGESPGQIPGKWEKYQPVSWADTQILWSDPLPLLESDPQKVLKNKLWTQIKGIFLS